MNKNKKQVQSKKSICTRKRNTSTSDSRAVLPFVFLLGTTSISCDTDKDTGDPVQDEQDRQAQQDQLDNLGWYSAEYSCYGDVPVMLMAKKIAAMV